jgi:hypothetical protein
MNHIEFTTHYVYGDTLIIKYDFNSDISLIKFDNNIVKKLKIIILE